MNKETKNDELKISGKIKNLDKQIEKLDKQIKKLNNDHDFSSNITREEFNQNINHARDLSDLIKNLDLEKNQDKIDDGFILL